MENTGNFTLLVKFTVFTFLVLLLGGTASSKLYSQVEFGERVGAIPSNYNLKIDEFYFSLSPTASIGWDSNYDRSSDGGEGSMVSSVGFLLDVLWPLSPYLAFSSSVDVGYYIYSGRGGSDGLQISGGEGGAAASWGVDLLLDDDTRIRLFTAAKSSLEGAVVEQSNQSENNRTVQTIEYSLNADYFTQLTPNTSLDTGYRYARTLASRSEFSQMDATRHEFNLAFNSQLNDELSAGAYLEHSILLPDSIFRSELLELSAGLRFRLDMGGGSATLLLGMSYFDFIQRAPADSFQGGVEPRVEAGLNFGSPNGWTHGLLASYENRSRGFIFDDSNTGMASSSRENVSRVGYSVSVPLTESTSLTAQTGLNYVTSSGEDSKRWDFGLAANYQVTPRLSSRLAYEYENQFDANQSSLKYDRIQIVLAFTYRL